MFCNTLRLLVIIFLVVSPAQGSVAESVTRVHNKELEMSEKWRKIFEKGPEPRVLIEPLGSQSQIISPSLKPPPPKEPQAVVLLEPLDEKVSSRGLFYYLQIKWSMLNNVK